MNLLTVLKRLLYISEGQDSVELLEALTSFNNACPSKSLSKKKSVRLIADLMIQEKILIPANIGNGWLHSLAKTLCQIDTDNIPLTNYILSRLAQIGIIAKYTGKYDFDILNQSFGDIFYKSKDNKNLYGPFNRWPLDSQRKVAEVLNQFNSFSSNFVAVVGECFKHEKIDESTRTYFKETIKEDQFSNFEDYTRFIEMLSS